MILLELEVVSDELSRAEELDWLLSKELACHASETVITTQTKNQCKYLVPTLRQTGNGHLDTNLLQEDHSTLFLYLMDSGEDPQKTRQTCALDLLDLAGPRHLCLSGLRLLQPLFYCPLVDHAFLQDGPTEMLWRMRRSRYMGHLIIRPLKIGRPGFFFTILDDDIIRLDFVGIDNLWNPDDFGHRSVYKIDTLLLSLVLLILPWTCFPFKNPGLPFHRRLQTGWTFLIS